jgi:hypothetical protein
VKVKAAIEKAIMKIATDVILAMEPELGPESK